jgi:hypothetical protein
MGMYHSTSGKIGYDAYTEIIDKRYITADKMKLILQREDQLRMSPEYHAMISERDDLGWIKHVTEQLQQNVLIEFGYDPVQFMPYLHSARARFANNEDMNKLTVYQRMDRSTRGNLVKGATLPNVKLCTLYDEGCCEEVYLYDYIQTIQKESGRPMLISAGSIT